MLEDYESRIDGFTFDYCVGDPTSTSEKKGYVTNHFEPHHLAEGDVDIYLCGPPPMVEGVRRYLEAEGIKPQNFYFEKFALAVTPDAAEAPAATAAAAGEGNREAPAALPAYEIGEEHATFQAQFDARMALELAIVELTMGKLTPEQLTEFKLLAELAGKTLDGEQFVSSEEFTVTNEAFHDFLFNCVGNEHLLQAYTRLEVPATMAKVLRKEHWIDGAVDADHLAIVAAFEQRTGRGPQGHHRPQRARQGHHGRSVAHPGQVNAGNGCGERDRHGRIARFLPPRPFRLQGRAHHRCRPGHWLGRGQADCRRGRGPGPGGPFPVGPRRRRGPARPRHPRPERNRRP